MGAENQPGPGASTVPQHDNAASIMSTLDQVNQAARRAAEGSTGTWSSPNLPHAGAEEAPAAEAEEIQACSATHLRFHVPHLSDCNVLYNS